MNKISPESDAKTEKKNKVLNMVSSCYHRSLRSFLCNFFPAAFILSLLGLFLVLSAGIFGVFSVIELFQSLSRFSSEIDDSVEVLVLYQKSNEVIPKSLRAFFFGSALVDNSEFTTFVADSEIFQGIQTRFSWLGLVPAPQKTNFLNTLKSIYLINTTESNFYSIDAGGNRVRYTDVKDYYFPLVYSRAKDSNSDYYQKNFLVEYPDQYFTSEEKQEFAYCIKNHHNFIRIKSSDFKKSKCTLEVFFPEMKNASWDAVLSKQNGVVSFEFSFEDLLKNSLGDKTLELMEVHIFYRSSQIFSSSGDDFYISSYWFFFPVSFPAKKVYLYGNEFEFIFKPTNAFWFSQLNFTRWILIGILFIFLSVVGVLGITCYKAVQWSIEARIRQKFFSSIAISIASLDLDAKPVKRIERKRHLTSVEETLKVIVDNLKLYLPYLPAHLRPAKQHPQDGESAFFDQKRYNSMTSSKNQSSAKLSQKGSNASMKEKAEKRKASEFTDISSGSGGKKKVNPALTGLMASKERNLNRTDLGIAKRIVTLLLIDLSNFNVLMSEAEPSELVQIYSEYLSSMTSIVEKNNGSFHKCNADKMIYSWNACNMRLTGAHDAVESAVSCLKLFQNKLLPRWSKHISSDVLALKIAISTSECWVGNVGCDTIRMFDIWGPAVNKVYSLVKHNSKLNTSILVDAATWRESSTNFHGRLIDRVFFAKAARITTLSHSTVDRDSNYEFIFEVFGKKEIENDEWFYEMDKLDKQTQRTPLEEAFITFLEQKEPEKTLEIIEEHMRADTPGGLSDNNSSSSHLKELDPNWQRIKDLAEKYLTNPDEYVTIL